MVFAPHEDGRGIIDVLVVTENVLLGDVLESLLTCEGHTRVGRIMHPQHHNLIQEIGSQRPDVYVIEQSLLSVDVLKIVSERWQTYRRLRVVVINPHNNRVHVWENLGTSILQATDFISLITSSSVC